MVRGTHNTPRAPQMDAQEISAGRQPSRRQVLLAGAATGLAAAASPLEHAYAAWNATLPRSLQGTITFTAYLYMSGAANVASGKQPGIVYGRYLKQHPGVKLVMAPEPSGDNAAWNAWFLPRAISNRLPDLLQPGVSCWPFIQRGFMTAITKYLYEPNPYIPGNRRWIDSVPKGFLNPFIGLDGQYYGFCADTAALWFYYNSEHLDRVGLKPPQTWAELMAACRALQAKGVTPFSMGPGAAFLLSWLFLFAESSLWASEFPKDTSLDVAGWVRALKKGLLKKTDDRTRTAWKLIKEFYGYWAKGTLGIAQASPQLYHDFSVGKFTFLFDGSWEIGNLTALTNGRFPVTVLPLGIPPMTRETSRYATGALEANGAPALNGINLWTTQHARDHLDLVVDFLRYYSSPQAIGPMATEVGEIPMVSGIGTLPPLLQKGKDIAYQPGLLMTPYFSADAAYTTKYDQMAKGYLAGAISLDAALSTLEDAQQVVAARLAPLMHA